MEKCKDGGMTHVLQCMSLMTKMLLKPIMRLMMDRKYKWEVKYDLKLLESDPSN